MDLRTLIENATDDELPAIAAAFRRAEAKPCVLVTVQEGNKRRRYVVAQEDEERIRPLIGKDIHRAVDYFGAQWLRSFGKVDEMYRSLSLSDVVKIEEADRKRVWGEP